MDEYQHILRSISAFANMADHSGCGFSRVDWVQHNPLGLCKKAHSLGNAFARNAVAVAHVTSVIVDLGFADDEVEPDDSRGLIRDCGCPSWNMKFRRSRDSVHAKSG